MATDPATNNLFAINRIVVLMLENRSFDHMLGYLTTAGLPDVDGLTGQERNAAPDGTEYPVFELPADQTAFHRPGQPFDQSLDPCHSPRCVAEQLSDGNGGFVKNFVHEKNPPVADRGLVMGHYTAQHLPTYDFLARNFCVCDRWHSSIPGDTWPNRVYALTGRPDKLADLSKEISMLERLLALVGIGNKAGANVPIYDGQAFTRQLDDSQWRWYSHDPATLRCADATYRNWSNPRKGNFRYFDRLTGSALTEAIEKPLVAGGSFLDDAANGTLPDVSWIDPNFVDLHVLDPTSNDDHPPSDIGAGQALVFEVYNALTQSPDWESTLLVIAYDEHGGFYDHVAPPPVSDESKFSTYGLRVPAILVGPRVRQFVCHDLFDHTSLIKTILLRFAADPGSALAAMGSRVQQAAHLGVALADGPRPTPDHGALSDTIDQWHQKARDQRRAGPQAASPAPDGAGQPMILNDFQREFAGIASYLAKRLGPGHP